MESCTAAGSGLVVWADSDGDSKPERVASPPGCPNNIVRLTAAVKTAASAKWCSASAIRGTALAAMWQGERFVAALPVVSLPIAAAEARKAPSSLG